MPSFRQNRHQLQQEQRMTRILQNHLQDEGTHDTTIGFAQKMASMAGSGLKKVGSVAASTFSQLASSSSQEPTNTSLLFDEIARTRKTDYLIMNTPRLTVGDKLPHAPKEKKSRGYCDGNVFNKILTSPVAELPKDLSGKGIHAPPAALQRSRFTFWDDHRIFAAQVCFNCCLCIC